MDRGAWQAAAHGLTNDSVTKQQQHFLGWHCCTKGEGQYLKGILATYAILRGHR